MTGVDAFEDEAGVLPVSDWFEGPGGWPTGFPERLALIASLESRLPTSKMHATEQKSVSELRPAPTEFSLRTGPPGIEAERLLPLTMVRDIQNGSVDWDGKRLVNPWNGRQHFSAAINARIAYLAELGCP